MNTDSYKTAKRIEWSLVALALGLMVVAWFKADDSPLHAALLGGAAIAIAILLSIITEYLEKHT